MGTAASGGSMPGGGVGMNSKTSIEVLDPCGGERLRLGRIFDAGVIGERLLLLTLSSKVMRVPVDGEMGETSPVYSQRQVPEMRCHGGDKR